MGGGGWLCILSGVVGSVECRMCLRSGSGLGLGRDRHRMSGMDFGWNFGGWLA